jgi:hypothetical protein
MFLCDPPKCLQDTTPALCSWYRAFTNHALLCGYYIVPYKLLPQGHGAHNGFEFDIDLPDNKCSMYFDWQKDIGQVLHQSNMFPKDSHFVQCVASTNNGFITLLALLTNTYPVFVDQPIILAMNWPTQTAAENIFNFYTKFLDHIRLCAIFMSSADNMGTSTMVDCFINDNFQHSSYLFQVSRFDHQDPKKLWPFCSWRPCHHHQQLPFQSRQPNQRTVLPQASGGTACPKTI